MSGKLENYGVDPRLQEEEEEADLAAKLAANGQSGLTDLVLPGSDKTDQAASDQTTNWKDVLLAGTNAGREKLNGNTTATVTTPVATTDTEVDTAVDIIAIRDARRARANETGTSTEHNSEQVNSVGTDSPTANDGATAQDKKTFRQLLSDPEYRAQHEARRDGRLTFVETPTPAEENPTETPTETPATYHDILLKKGRENTEKAEATKKAAAEAAETVSDQTTQDSGTIQEGETYTEFLIRTAGKNQAAGGRSVGYQTLYQPEHSAEEQADYPDSDPRSGSPKAWRSITEQKVSDLRQAKGSNEGQGEADEEFRWREMRILTSVVGDLYYLAGREMASPYNMGTGANYDGTPVDWKSISDPAAEVTRRWATPEMALLRWRNDGKSEGDTEDSTKSDLCRFAQQSVMEAELNPAHPNFDLEKLYLVKYGLDLSTWNNNHLRGILEFNEKNGFKNMDETEARMLSNALFNSQQENQELYEIVDQWRENPPTLEQAKERASAFFKARACQEFLVILTAGRAE